MSNTLSVIDMVAREALRIAHEKATFIGTINRSYDDSFAKTGAKIGSTLKVRNPNRFVRRQGSRVMDVQDVTETTQTITVATQDGVDLRFNSAELSQSIDDLSARYIEPAMAALVSGIESDVITGATKLVYNLEGTAGTVVGASADISAITYARGKLNFGLAPKDNRALQMDSLTMGSVTNGIKGLFHDGTQLKEAFREGFIARNAMADWYENERTYTHSTGADMTTVTMHGTPQVTDGGTTMAITSATLAVGDIFTVAGVYACHPETKQKYGHLQQFTVTAITTASTLYEVSPPTYLGLSDTTAPLQNICSSTGAKLALTAFDSTPAVVPFGGNSTAYRQNLMYHKDFMTFVTADLPIMDDALKCVRRTQDGISLRVWQASDIRNDEMLMRIDILYGWKVLRPEWACRISN